MMVVMITLIFALRLGVEVFRLAVTSGTIAWTATATALEEVLVADSTAIVVSIGDQKETDITEGTDSPYFKYLCSYGTEMYG